ncbi:MAG: protein phosphatase 2C domain-containing protein [bacterium]|nr:protein phosphatase 2C domain-containing protein [bacterium]
MKVAASALSDPGLKRDGNEDQYLIDESLGLYIVCDGMGGHAAGEVAAERAIEYVTDFISARSHVLDEATVKPEGYFRILKIAEEAVQTASQEVYRLASSSSEYAGMGTTMTMLVIVQSKAVMAHVGDSRLYLQRAGDIHQLTVDHTLANEMYLAGGLTREEAERSKFQHVLTRCIGSHESVVVDTLLFDLLPGDRLLLCSDGLSNYFKDPSVVADLLSKRNIVSKPEPLIDFAKRSGGADNITAVVVEALRDEEQETVPDTPQRIEALQNSCLGRKLSVSRLLHLLTTCTMLHCNQGKELIAMGDKCPGMFVVMEGSFRIIDDDLIEAELQAGQSFGQQALIAPAKSPVTLVAQEPAKVLLVDRRKFNRLTRRMPRMGNALLRNLARELSQQIVDADTAERMDLDDTGPLP